MYNDALTLHKGENMQVCKARVIAKSKSAVTGKIITTIEAEFPRIVLAEFNTHNAISKNASSSRAIPVPKMLEQVRTNPAFPARFGAANKGMQDKGEHSALVPVWGGWDNPIPPDLAWEQAAKSAAFFAEKFHEAGYAKQVCNRLIEPFQMMKVVMTATEWNNFMWLRNHGAADPSIEQLAKVIKEAIDGTEVVELQPGEWHVPYYNDGVWKLCPTLSTVEPCDKFGHTLEHALMISSSCCAQVSFRSLDDTIEKAKGVVAKLNLHGEEPDQPVHASPLEHQATPIIELFDDELFKPMYWPEGVTHVDRDGTLCSGNLKGFIQHRQLVPNHVKRG